MSAVTAAAWEGEAVGPGVRVEKSFHQGYPGMQEGKRERKGLKIPDKREMKEGVQSSIPPCWWGSARTCLFEIRTSNSAPLALSPISAFGQITGPGCISSARDILCVDCTQTSAFTALKGLSRTSPVTLCTAKIHRTPFSLRTTRVEACLLCRSTSEGADTSHQAGANNCFTLHKGSPGPGTGC